MPQFTSKAPYVKQVSLYLKNGDYQKALSLSREFAETFPEEMIAHFFHAKSAFWTDELEIAERESSKAFNLSKGEEELAVAGILRACILFRMKKYAQGMKLLKLLNTKVPGKREEIKKLEFVFSLALKDEAEALAHLEGLYKINKDAASEFISGVLSRYV